MTARPLKRKGRKDYDRIQSFASMEKKIAKARRDNDDEYREWLQNRPAYFWPKIFREVKRLLSLLGCPYVQAPSEGEAQAAFLNLAGIAGAVVSQDYDALLFGAAKLYRRAPGPKATYVLLDSTQVLPALALNRNKLVDVAILAGTDFNPGVPGVGPKTAAKLVRDHECIEGIPETIKRKYGFKVLPHATIEAARATFLGPDVLADIPAPSWREPSREALIHFCCNEHHLNETRVTQAMMRWAGKLRRAPKQSYVYYGRQTCFTHQEGK